MPPQAMKATKSKVSKAQEPSPFWQGRVESHGEHSATVWSSVADGDRATVRSRAEYRGMKAAEENKRAEESQKGPAESIAQAIRWKGRTGNGCRISIGGGRGVRQRGW